METQESGTAPRFAAAHKREERIRLMIQELSLDAATLSHEIEMALQIARARPNDYAYPSYAKATAQRRDNLLRTIENLRQQSRSRVERSWRSRDYDLTSRPGPESQR
jgi:hypothetical protein